MKAKQFKPIILKSLQQYTGKVKTYTEFADLVVSKMEQFEEMFDMLSGEGLIERAIEQPSITHGSLIITPGSEDISGRVASKIPDHIWTDEEIERAKQSALKNISLRFPQRSRSLRRPFSNR